MGLKLKNGTYTLQKNGLPQTNTEEEELLQNVSLRLSLMQGSFPYERNVGSRLDRLDRQGEHAKEQAVSLANEALLDLPGVQAEQVTILSSGTMQFTLSTPFGTETVQVRPAAGQPA